MEALYLFILLLIALTIGFGIILGQSSRVDTMAHWGERRCDLDVILAAFYYKPDSDTRSATEFSTDNFKFCVGSMATDYLNTLFGSLFEVLRIQMGASDILGQAMVSMKGLLNKIFAPFSSMINKFMNKFKQIGTLASRVFQQLYMSMKKAAAAATATIFIAISMQTAFLNGIDLVIKIIMIVLYILLALAFIFFLPIIPVMVFVTMAVGGIEAAMPGRTGGMGDVFCFAADTQIVMNNFTMKPIQSIQLGDILYGKQVVEAIIELPFLQPFYEINGILVSGDHLVWYSKENKLIPVKDHPDSTISDKIADTVWTLITSSRRIPIRGLTGITTFGDWEEQPDTKEAAEQWEMAVRYTLRSNSRSSFSPITPPCLDKNIKVKRYQSGWIPLSEVKRGDWIQTNVRWTQVLGICHRQVQGGIMKNGYRISDGVWILKDKWTHFDDTLDKVPWKGMQLITDSGSFMIAFNDIHNPIAVRDFTEVGWSNLHKTYARIEEVATQKR